MGEHKKLLFKSLQQGYPQTKENTGPQSKKGCLQNEIYQNQGKRYVRIFLEGICLLWESRRILCGGERKTKDEMGEIYEQT